MGLLLSVVIVAILIVIGVLGSYVPFLFAVVLPYMAVVVFLVGIVWRIVKWAKSPVPFRIPTTCGQQKSFDWIRQNKLDNPYTTLGVWGRMLLEVLFFRSLFRNTKMDLKEGPKLTYKDDKYLWLFSLAFHWSFLVIFLRHFRFFGEQTPSFVPFLQELDGFLKIGVPEVYITNIAIGAGLLFLFFRRIFNSKVRYISLASDYFPLLLIISIAVTGILMRYFYKTDLFAVKQFVVSLVNFNPIIPDGVSSLFYLHFFLVCVLLIYFPMSKLVHMPGIFMSPTRNLANNSRAVRHINPWNPEVEVHTYEEYEDEFRPLMIAAGIPVEKEEKNGSN